MIAIIRSIAFETTRFTLTVIFSLVAVFTTPLKPISRYQVITIWSRLITRLSKTICGIDYRVVGIENLPHEPCVILSNHQSSWETFAFQVIFPPQVWVLKKSLLRIPFFGWGLAMMNPIAIDRSSGTEALRQMLHQGKDRIINGWYVIVFPEGTRMKPTEKAKYQPGGAWLARKLEVPILPVAHNAGVLWSKNALVKKPGIITVTVGEPIQTKDRSVNSLIDEASSWIELNKYNEG